VYDVVEVVLAVSFDEELCAAQQWVTTRVRLIGQVCVAVESDATLEQLHANQSVDVVEQLKVENEQTDNCCIICTRGEVFSEKKGDYNEFFYLPV
jgi:hypothetical protein